MNKMKLSVLSLCLAVFLLFTGCGSQIEGTPASEQPASVDASEISETNTPEKVSNNIETDTGSINSEAAEAFASSTPENDTDVGLKNIKIDTAEVNLTNEQKAVLEYFDIDYLEIPSYEFLRRYPNVFQGSQVTIYGSVKKIISMDNDNYELAIWLNVVPYGMAYDEEYYNEAYAGQYVLLRGKTDPSSWYMENDVLMAYGRYSGVETVEIDGTSYTIPCVDAYHANYAYRYRASIINDRFDYSAIKPVAQAIFGKNIEIREPVVDDFSAETALIYINTRLRYCPSIEDAREQEREYGVSEAFPYYLVELEDQSNANFTKFLFSTEEGYIIDAKDPPFDGVIERYVEFSADFEHFFLFTYNTSLETLKLSYYDKDLHKIWDREFENTTNAVYDYTKNNIYIVVNNELYVINIGTGEDTFSPSYIGSRVAIRKFSDGILTVSEGKSDGIMKSTLDGNIQWKANLSTDVQTVDGIQLVGDNLVIHYVDTNWSEHYVLVNYTTGEIVIDAESIG